MLQHKRKTVGVTILTAALPVLLILACSGSGNQSELVEEHKKLAGELRDSKLYKAAIEEYQKVLEIGTVDAPIRANVNYLIAEIYFENVRDYEKAAAYYIRARSIDPEGAFQSQASRNLVTALEKIGRVVDARRELSASTDIDAGPRQAGDVAVAQIGDEKIWLSEIDEQIQSLPPQLQERFVSPEQKHAFVKEYVGLELVYRAATRENYQSNPEIVSQHEQYLRQLLIDRYLVDKVIPQVSVDSMDVYNFYTTNKSNVYDDKPYDSVKARVFVDYQSQKAQQAFLDYVTDLAEAERVEIFQENIR